MADQPPSVVHGEIVAAQQDNLMLPHVEQLDLLPGDLADPAAKVREYRGRGRPPGATNIANRKFRGFVLSQHSHPGLALARVYDRPTELLAAELGCKMHEAAMIQVRAAAELLPYIEGKAPISVDVRRRSDVVLIMPGAGTSDEELAAITTAVNEAEEIDWASAEAGDVLRITSFSGGPLKDVLPEQGEQSGGEAEI